MLGGCGDGSVATVSDALNRAPDAFSQDARMFDAGAVDGPVPDADLSNAPPAFRVTRLWLRDPHVFTPELPPPLEGLSCTDVTDMDILGFSANGQIQQSIDSDGDDSDLYLDLSLVAVFEPLDSSAGATGNVTIGTANCLASTPRDCVASADAMSETTTYTNTGTGACMTLDQATLSSANYTPGIDIPQDDCFATGGVTIDFILAGAPLTLQNVSVAAEYNGTPNVQGLITGVMRGFLSEADAAKATIEGPAGPVALVELLRGTSDCPGPVDDRDHLISGDKGSPKGWWFYMNFEATRLLSYSAP